MIVKMFKTFTTMSICNKKYISNLLIDISSNNFDKPLIKPWSGLIFVFLFVGLILIICFGFLGTYLNKKNNEKIINVLIFSFGLTFLGFEIAHEILRFIKLGYYDFSSFPFQFCSVPMYLCLVLPFIKKEHLRMPGVYFLGIYGFIGGIFPLLFGQSQLCRWSSFFDVFHSFAWHILLLMNSLLLINFYGIGINKKESIKLFLKSYLLFISITVIAQILNVILHYSGGINYPIYSNPDGSVTNFKTTINTPLYDPDIASLFYISPFFRSNMIIFETIWVKAGWIINYLLYLVGFYIIGSILLILTILIKQIYCKIIYSQKIRNTDENF